MASSTAGRSAIVPMHQAKAAGLTNLPAHPIRLIGRDDALTVVRERLLGAERGLLTLTGDYTWRPSQALRSDGYRPLRSVPEASP